MEQKCVFCAIASRQIPASVVYEDEKVLGFLDINPLTEGHTLVIPKNHAVNIFDISAEDLKHILLVAQKISNNMKNAIQAEGVDLVQASGETADQTVPHFHLHIIPRKTDDKLDLRQWWVSRAQQVNPARLKELAERLRTEKIEESGHVEKTEEKPKERSKEDTYWIKRAMQLT